MAQQASRWIPGLFYSLASHEVQLVQVEQSTLSAGMLPMGQAVWRQLWDSFEYSAVHSRCGLQVIKHDKAIDGL